MDRIAREDRSGPGEDMALVRLGRVQAQGVVVVGCSIPFEGRVGTSFAEAEVDSEIADHMRLEGRIEYFDRMAMVSHRRSALAGVVALRPRMGEVRRLALTL